VHLCRNAWVRVGDLNDCWASGDSLVVDLVVAASKDNVALAVDALGHGDFEATVNWGGISEDGAGDGDESSVDWGLSVRGGESVAGCQEVDAVAALNGAGGAESESREGLEGQLGLLGVRIRAGADERGGEGVDLVEGQWVVEGLRERRLLATGTNVRRVAGLDSQDRASGGQVVAVRDGSGCAQVGTDSNAFKDTSKGDE